MRHSTGERLRAITVPTLVVAGSLDVMTKADAGRQVAELIPGALFVVMEGEAHQPFQEVPEQFSAIVTAFWDRLR